MSEFRNYAKDLIESNADHESVVSEGIKNLKGKIKDLDIKVSTKTPAQKSVEAKPRVEPSNVTDVVNKYRETIRQTPGVDTPEVKEQPVTKASVENTKAVARALAGMRNGNGDVGEGSCTTPNGNGNVGNPGNYAAKVSSMTLEEYQSHIFGSFGLTEEASEGSEASYEELTEEYEETVVEYLEERLLELEERTWQEVDRVTREVCAEEGMSLKELNREFREEHGVYPDKWAKNHEEPELCGYFPLEEAVRINKIGQVYDVSFLYRGTTQRFSFFWPEAGRPTFEDMQGAVQKFYPKARLLTFYLSRSNDANFMVAVPPMNESYDFVIEETWVEMSEVDSITYDTICEEIGEPLSPAVCQENGGYGVVVADHDTGEENTIYFGEDIGTFFSTIDKEATLHYAVSEDWQKSNRKDGVDGMSQKSVNAYRRENPGSKLQTAVTENNPKGKRAGRRRSYCSRSEGQKDMHNIDCSKTPDKNICKARRRWNC